MIFFEKVLFYIKNKKRGIDFFELGNFFILYYFLIFYLTPILFFLGGSRLFKWENSVAYQNNYFQTFLYLTSGIIFFAIGYYNRKLSFIAERVSNFLKLKSEWDFKKVPWVFGICLISGLGVKILKIFGGVYAYWQQNAWLQNSAFFSLIGIFDWLSYVALIIAFSSYFYFLKIGDDRYHLWKKIAWGTFILEIVYILPSCNRTFMLIPIFFYLILRYYFLHITWRQIIVIIFGAMIILFPFGNACRNPEILPHYFSIEKPNRSLENNLTYVRNFGELVFNSIFSRIDQSVVFSKIIEMDEKPLYGKTLLNFFISLGPPRFIWHDKPIITGGGDFGHRSGLLSPKVESTTVGVTIIGDLYMNFRFAGIIIGMGFMGVLLNLIYGFLIKETRHSLSGVMIYSIIWLNIIKGMEDWIAPVYAGLVKIFVLLLIVHYFLIKHEKNI